LHAATDVPFCFERSIPRELTLQTSLGRRTESLGSDVQVPDYLASRLAEAKQSLAKTLVRLARDERLLPQPIIVALKGRIWAVMVREKQSEKTPANISE
jgi:hypothetical protein